MSEPEYQDRTVAFLDILGFRQLVIKNKIGVIKDALDESAAILAATSNKPMAVELQTSQFSDSIIISALNPELSLTAIMANSYVVDFARQIAMKLLYAGVLCRGGVTLGKMYHDQRHGFGPALVRAYEIESEMAIYPRIVLGDEVVRHYIPFLNSEILCGNDGLHYINIFKLEAVIAAFGKDALTTMAHFGKVLRNMRIEVVENNKVRAKIDWAIVNHNWATGLMKDKLEKMSAS